MKSIIGDDWGIVVQIKDAMAGAVLTHEGMGRGYAIALRAISPAGLFTVDQAERAARIAWFSVFKDPQ